MQFTENEMTTMLHGVAKTQMALSARLASATDRDHALTLMQEPVTEDDKATAWEALSKFERYQVIAGLSEYLLPVLPLLPEVTVEPGSVASFETEQVIAAARESVAADVSMEKVPAEHADDLTTQRAALTTTALRFLPTKPVQADDLDGEFPVVPDSPEGLV